MAEQTVTLRIASNVDGLVTGVRQVREELGGVGDASEASAERSTQAMRRSAQGADFLTSQIQKVRSEIIALGAAWVSIEGVRALAGAADAYSDMQARIRLVADTQAEFSRGQSEAFRIAQDTSSQLEATVGLYTRLDQALGDVGASQAEVLSITETVNKSFAVSGSSGGAAAGAITQLSQAFAAGALRGDEFNSVNEAAPRLMQALAASLGVTRGELRGLAEDGELTADVLRRALTGEQAQAIAEEFAELPLTIARSMQQLRNAAVQFIGESDQTIGASQAIAAVIQLVAQNLDLLAGVTLAAATVYGARFLPALLPSVATLKAVSAAMVIATTSTSGFAIASRTAAASLLGLVGGPVGVAVLAIGGLALGIKAAMDAEAARDAAFQAGVASIEASTQRVRELNAQWEEYSSLRQPSAAESASAFGVETEEIKAQRAELQQLTETYRDLLNNAAFVGGDINSTETAQRWRELTERIAEHDRQTARLAATLRQQLAPELGNLQASIDRLANSDGVGSALDGIADAYGALLGLSNRLAADAKFDELYKQITEGSQAAEEALEKAELGVVGYAKKLADEFVRTGTATGRNRAEVEALGKQYVSLVERLELARRAKQRGSSEDERAARASEQLIERLREQVETYGMSEAAVGRYRLAQSQLTDSQREEAEGLLALMEAWETYAEVVTRADQAVQELGRGNEDLDARLRDLQDELAGLTPAQREFNRALEEANRLYAEALVLGPPTEEAQAAYEDRLRKIAAIRDAELQADASAELADNARRAADESARAWQSFADGLVTAFRRGGDGVKQYFKRLLQDLLAQWASSALLRSMASFFGGSVPGLANAAGGGGYMSQLGAMFGGGANASGGGGFNLGGTGTGSMVNTGLSWLGNSPTAQTALGYAPYLAAAGGALYGLNNRGGSTGSGGSLAAGAAYGYAGYALGTVATGALLGAGAGAATGVAGAAAGGALAGGAGAAAAIPVVGWIVAALALIDAFSGGKLFGTRYKPDELVSSIGIENGEAFTESSLTEVRNRSLFRGRQWRQTDLAATPEAIEAAEQLFHAVDQTMTDAARQLRGSAPELLDVAIRTVQDFDSKGRATTSKLFVDVLGRSWEEATQELAATRITAESIISTIDQVLGTTVSGVAQSVGDAYAEGVESGLEAGGADRIGDQAAMVLKSATAGVLGEATAIAERWRGDAEQLLAGAQFLLGIATDLRSGFDLLETGTLTPIVELVEELARGGESLQQTYARIVLSTQSLEGAVTLMGAELDLAREDFVRFAVDIADAAGGLERAQSLWNSFFARFFTPEERLEMQATQTRGAAQREFDDISLSLDDFTGDGGMAEFRRIFTELLPTLSADAVVQWLEAADALGLVLDIDAQRTAGLRAQAEAAAEAEAQRVADLASLIDGFRSQAFDAAIELAEWDLTPLQRELAAIQRASQEAARAAIELGATEEQLAEIRAGFATQAILAQRRAEQNLNQLLDGLRFDDALAGMSEVEQQIARNNRRYDDYVAQAIALGASEAQIAEIRAIQVRENERITRSAQGAADAIGRAGDQLRRIREFGSDVRSSIAALGDDLRGWINQLTGYTPEVQGATATLAEAQAEIRRRFAQQEAGLQAERASLLRELLAQGWDVDAGGSGYVTPTIRVLLGQLAAVDTALGGIGQSMVELEGYAALAFAARQQAVLDGLRQWRESLLQDTQLSVLTPAQRFADVQRQYLETLAAAESGDANAQQALQGIAQQYLQQAREMYASGEQYTSIFAQVLADTGALIEDVFGEGDGVESAIQALADAPVFAGQLAVLQSILDVLRGDDDGLPSYDVGTAYVPSTGPALIHRGETILPAAVADFARRSGLSLGPAQGVSTEPVVAELRALREDVRRGDAAVAERLERVERGQERSAIQLVQEQRALRDQIKVGSR